ncbi:hypothetical protein SAMN05443662_1655 [Sulfurivirga caldicuralii]|uniref:Outer membrane protein n=1 Tax=Sulfurivirga caldicuralii TaxID=364032 RepID=A0A1N6HCM3_9GAMM|nr:hypothetical protein [Sulfurivirga caldicuralii]SIO17503.1 hypothetical protein SAMN05443662_1655 [Sulfurivirga caldicuralii]
MKMRSLALAMLVAAPIAAQAADTVNNVGVGIVGGTAGAGIALGYRINDKVTLRGEFTKWRLSDTKTIDDVDYDVDLDLGSVGAYLDWHPFAGNFRVSAGFANNLNELRVKNASTETTTVGDATVSINPGDLRGKANFDSAPYLGIGWGNAAPKGWGFRFDLGAWFLGKADVSLSASNTVRTAIQAQGKDPDTEIRKEEQKARNDIGDVVYPNVSIAVSYGW